MNSKMPEGVKLDYWAGVFAGIDVLKQMHKVETDEYVSVAINNKNLSQWSPTTDLNQSRLVLEEIKSRGLLTPYEDFLIELYFIVGCDDLSESASSGEYWAKFLMATPLQICQAAYLVMDGEY